MNSDTIPFGVEDLDSSVIIKDGPPRLIKCVVKHCQTFLEPANRMNGSLNRHSGRPT